MDHGACDRHTIEGGLPRVKPKTGLGLPQLGAPTATGKAAGGGRAHETRAADIDLANYTVLDPYNIWHVKIVLQL